MAETFKILAIIAIFVVAIVLAMGLFNMMRGGSANRSQKLMRWRVFSQFIAVIIMVAAFYFTR